MVALHRWTNQDRYGFPSHSSIAKVANVSVPTVKRGIKALEDIGALTVVTRWRTSDGQIVYEKIEGADQTSNGYQIRYAQPLNDPPLDQIRPDPLDQIRTPPGVQIRSTNQTHLEPDVFKPENTDPVQNEIVEVVPEWEIQFDQFWAIYPRRNDKQKAKIKFKNLSKKDREAAMAAITLHIDYWDRQRTEQEFIPYAVRWLGNSRWEDEIRYEPPKGKNNPVLENLARKYQSEHRTSDPDTRQTDRGDNRLGRSSVGNLSIEVHSTD
jgi:hypothetical protein